MIKAVYAGKQFGYVAGYSVIARFDTGSGIGNEMYVVVVGRCDAGTKLPGVGLDPAIGDLQIAGDSRQYKFEHVALNQIMVRQTRRSRQFVAMFQADFSRPSEPTVVTLENSDTRELSVIPAMGNDWTLALDGEEPEQLLGFDSAVGPQGDTVFRFVTVSNGRNRWLDKVVGVQRSLHDHMDMKAPERTIRFGFSQSAGQQLEINGHTATTVYVAEVYGACLGWSVLPMNEITGEAHAQHRVDVDDHHAPPPKLSAKLLLPDMGLRQFLAEEERAAQAPPVHDRNATLDIAAVVFRAGHYNRLTFT